MEAQQGDSKITSNESGERDVAKNEEKKNPLIASCLLLLALGNWSIASCMLLTAFVMYLEDKTARTSTHERLHCIHNNNTRDAVVKQKKSWHVKPNSVKGENIKARRDLIHQYYFLLIITGSMNHAVTHDAEHGGKVSMHTSLM